MEGAAGAMGEHECIGRGTIAQGEGVLIDDRTGEGGQPVRVKDLGRGATLAVDRGVLAFLGLCGGGRGRRLYLYLSLGVDGTFVTVSGNFPFEPARS